MVDVTLQVGSSRVGGDGNPLRPSADVIVGTYEGIDHALRTGKNLGDIGTVVIDEVHTLGEEERGHRLDGLISPAEVLLRGRTPAPTAPSGSTSRRRWGIRASWVTEPAPSSSSSRSARCQSSATSPSPTARRRPTSRTSWSGGPSTASPARGTAARPSSSPTLAGAVTRSLSEAGVRFRPLPRRSGQPQAQPGRTPVRRPGHRRRRDHGRARLPGVDFPPPRSSSTRWRWVSSGSPSRTSPRCSAAPAARTTTTRGRSICSWNRTAPITTAWR